MATNVVTKHTIIDIVRSYPKGRFFRFKNDSGLNLYYYTGKHTCAKSSPNNVGLSVIYLGPKPHYNDSDYDPLPLDQAKVTSIFTTKDTEIEVFRDDEIEIMALRFMDVSNLRYTLKGLIVPHVYRQYSVVALLTLIFTSIVWIIVDHFVLAQ